ncbi:DNA polymerase IV [Mesoplasma syrphidae]|uniref:DNA polymerase IV n=1 Tax=Mesoplasma syrphidae TaxID=225999 RepID=A0A2K9C5M5_9MOLU|nr:DNA polymerase IV [Mesoplasma syrphidae]AUF83587.1 DNA polymerase IV [Mesoplasma syrphidae]
MSMNNHKIIFHLDMDAFFANCMQSRYPELKGKPVVISRDDRRSIITAASYEARKYGVKSAMPIFEAKKLCIDLIIMEPDYALFSEISRKIWELIDKHFTPKLEIASIDECYIDVTSSWQKFGSPKKMAEKIQETIYKELKLTCSIGISFTKFLAKMSSDMNKPNGITMLSPQLFNQKIWRLPIGQMYGVGKRTAELMTANGILLIHDLAKAENNFLIEKFGDYAIKLKLNALGQGSDLVKIDNNILKSISNEITLDIFTNDINELEDKIFHIAANVSSRAVKRRMKARTVSIIIRYEEIRNKGQVFDKLDHIKTKRRQESIPEYSNDLEIIYSTAKFLFNEMYDSSKRISLIGVGLSNLVLENSIPQQLSLWSENANLKAFKDSSKLISEINEKLGFNSLTSGKEFQKVNQSQIDNGKFLKNYDSHILNKELRKIKKGK